jgi:hypothetical protein
MKYDDYIFKRRSPDSIANSIAGRKFMDLFNMLNISDPSENPTPPTNKKADKNATAKSKNVKPSSIKSSGKANRVTKTQTQGDIRKMLIGLDWTVHYATHSYVVESLGRRLVEMEADEISAGDVKAALWAIVPEDVKEALEAARLAKAEAEAIRIEEQNSSEPATVELETDPSEETESDDDMEFDEDKGEMVKKSVTTEVVSAPDTFEIQDGDLTIDMLRQSLALDYFEFASEEGVNWRVDKNEKRLYPTISAGKMGC